MATALPSVTVIDKELNTSFLSYENSRFSARNTGGLKLCLLCITAYRQVGKEVDGKGYDKEYYAQRQGTLELALAGV